HYPYLLDNTQATAKAYGAACTPDPFLFNKEGKLVFHGRLTDAMQPDDTATENTMEAALTSILAGEDIPPEPKPSMGCSIKWIE
ncbi:MAG: thioredoxin family protein, partial [archaeon]|nr:thioredoxin family protein [archaeon]